MFELLANRTYRRLFLAQIVALLGIALAIKMIAYVGQTPVASALTAHLPRRRC